MPIKFVKGVEYTFGGEYYCKDSDGYALKNYELSVVFPELLQAPLSVFKKGVSTPNNPIYMLMIKKYPDFNAVRTHYVLKVVNNTDKAPKKADDINVMNIEQLKVYISENELNINTAVYYDAVDKVREAITLAESDPEKFKEIYDKAVEEYKFNKQVAELNGNTDDNAAQKDNTDKKDKTENKAEKNNQKNNKTDKKEVSDGENGEDGGIDDLLGDLDNKGESKDNGK